MNSAWDKTTPDGGSVAFGATKPRKQRAFGTSMGVTSIIAILVILVLVTFAVLSITTSQADLNLSRRTADSVQAFYKADSSAEQKYAQVAEAVKTNPNGWQNDVSGLGVKVSADTTRAPLGAAVASTVAWTEPVDAARVLEVELTVVGNKVERTRWQITPNGEWSPDKSLNVFTPGR